MILFILFGAGDGFPPMSGSPDPDDAKNGPVAIFLGAALLVILLAMRCSEKCSAERSSNRTSPTVPATISSSR